MDNRDAQPPEPPVHLEGYNILGEVGRGGFGIVWKAEQTALGRMVAIKVLRSLDLMENSELRERFQREARIVARMATHENIVQVFDIKEANGVPCIIMEYVEGQSLGAWLSAQGRLPLRLAIDIVAQTALGLHHAHVHGVTHRDIKPENIMITTSGRVKVMDFGIARATSVSRMTATGLLVGTPQYMAPEQWDAKGEIDGRADIYSLSVVLFHIVCGRPPFSEPNWYSLGMKHMNTPPPSPMSITPFIPPALESIILRGMAKDPLDRFQSALDMNRALSGLLSQSGNTTEATPPGAVEPQVSPQLARLLRKSREVRGIGEEDETIPPELDQPEGTLSGDAPTKRSSVQAGPAMGSSASESGNNLRTQRTPGTSQPGPAQQPTRQVPAPAPAPPPRIQQIGPPAPAQPSPHMAVTPQHMPTRPQPRVARSAQSPPHSAPPPPPPDAFVHPSHTNLMTPDSMPPPPVHPPMAWAPTPQPTMPTPMARLEDQATYEGATVARSHRRRRWPVLLALFLLLAGGGYAAWHFYSEESERLYRTAMLGGSELLRQLGTMGAPPPVQTAGMAAISATQQVQLAQAANDLREGKREAAYDTLKRVAAEAKGVDPAVLLYELAAAMSSGGAPPAMTSPEGGVAATSVALASPPPPPGGASEESIAVLDFATPGAPANASEGMSFAIGLIPELRSPAYRVLKRPALMRLIGEARMTRRPETPDDAKLVGVARAAGVRFIVGGELMRAPEPSLRIRIVDTTAGQVVIDETLRAASLASLRAQLADAGRRYALRLGKM